MTAGRPLKYTTIEEIQPLIDKYFEDVPIVEWTITGLALALDTSRRVLCEYEGKDKFSNAIKKAKEMVENSYEIDLKKSGRTGTIFALKNFDWKDKTETDITSKGEKVGLEDTQINAIIQRRNGGNLASRET